MTQSDDGSRRWLWITRFIGTRRWTAPVIVVPTVVIMAAAGAFWIFTTADSSAGRGSVVFKASLTAVVVGCAMTSVIVGGRRVIKRHAELRFRLALESLDRSIAAQRRAIHTLAWLGRNHETYRHDVLEVFCACIRDTATAPEIRRVAVSLLHRHRIRNRDNYWGAPPLNLAGADLRDAKLSMIDLAGADLTNARLSTARLTAAILSNANLSGADLHGTRLNRAKLVGANLTGADLHRADLVRADLTNAKLTGADVRDVRLDREDLESKRMITAAAAVDRNPDVPTLKAAPVQSPPEPMDAPPLDKPAPSMPEPPRSSLFGDTDVSVYLDTSDEDRVDPLLAALNRVFDTEELMIEPIGRPQISSWWARFKVRAKGVASSKEVASRIAKIEMALEQHVLRLPMSEENVNQAKAVSELIDAVDNVPNAVMLTGSVMVIKWTDSDGNPSLFSKTLTGPERQAIESRPHLLTSPYDALQNLHLLTNTRPAGEIGGSTSSGALDS